MSADDVTNGELARRIDAVLAELRRIEDRYVSREAHEALKDRVGTLEEKAQTAMRMVWGSLILPLVLTAVVAVLVKGGP